MLGKNQGESCAMGFIPLDVVFTLEGGEDGNKATHPCAHTFAAGGLQPDRGVPAERASTADGGSHGAADGSGAYGASHRGPDRGPADGRWAGYHFLGFGVQPPVATWGNMLYEYQRDVWTQPLKVFFPGYAEPVRIHSRYRFGPSIVFYIPLSGLHAAQNRVFNRGRGAPLELESTERIRAAAEAVARQEGLSGP